MKMRFMLRNIFILLAFLPLSLQAKERLNIDLSLSDEKLYAFIFNSVPSSGPLQKLLSDFRIQEAETFDISKALDQLGRQLEELCRKNSEETELFSYAGWIFFMRREYAKAHSYLEKACLILDSQRANDWRRLAVLEGILDPQSSRQWHFFEQALELDPGSYDTFFLRGIAFLGEGEYQKALNDFNRGIAIQDNFEIRGLRGLAYCGTGQISRAITDLEQYLSMSPTMPQPFLFKCLAVCYLQEEQYSQALAILKKAEILFPEDTDFSLMCFAIYLHCQNTQECQKSLEICLKIAPDAPEVQLFEALWQVYNGNSTQGMKKLVSLEILADQGQITHSFVELLWMELAIRNYEQTELFFKSSEFCVESQEYFLKKLTTLKEKLKQFPNCTTVFQTLDIAEIPSLFLRQDE